jgi:hypothetical protein
MPTNGTPVKTEPSACRTQTLALRRHGWRVKQVFIPAHDEDGDSQTNAEVLGQNLTPVPLYPP